MKTCYLATLAASEFVYFDQWATVGLVLLKHLYYA